MLPLRRDPILLAAAQQPEHLVCRRGEPVGVEAEVELPGAEAPQHRPQVAVPVEQAGEPAVELRLRRRVVGRLGAAPKPEGGAAEAGDPRPLRLPLVLCRVRAGFPSPAEEYVEAGLDLNELLVKRPAATFFLRVEGDSMTGAGIHDGDLLVVDRAAEAGDGGVVVACVDGRMTIKRLRHGVNGEVRLEAEHPGYPPLVFRPPRDECDDAGVMV